ncbi:MAG: hypothetical protein PHQ72_01045 [Hespellia sp.]|nr:hypothetical protein [Hespellia sp.]
MVNNICAVVLTIMMCAITAAVFWQDNYGKEDIEDIEDVEDEEIRHEK